MVKLYRKLLINSKNIELVIKCNSDRQAVTYVTNRIKTNLNEIVRKWTDKQIQKLK